MRTKKSRIVRRVQLTEVEVETRRGTIVGLLDSELDTGFVLFQPSNGNTGAYVFVSLDGNMTYVGDLEDTYEVAREYKNAG